ncbi:deoxyribodipyrimidine photo-lyase [Oscillatoria laete-virens NRMC-F 0139]|nr:deoxyribodipyrimidine photo-lyase [Oscillatoria laete-virens NRMC-F 0139]
MTATFPSWFLVGLQAAVAQSRFVVIFCGMNFTLCWFRRDLRLHDNAAFYHALRGAARSGANCLGFFCFDREILDKLHDRDDRRVEFIRQSVQEMEDELKALGSGLVVRYGAVSEVFPELLEQIARQGKLLSVHAGHDYEPRRIERDRVIHAICAERGIEFHTCKDHVIFEKDEVLTKAGTPQRVYTPYKNAWYAKLGENKSFFLKPYPTVDKYAAQLAPRKLLPPSDPFGSVRDIGFEPCKLLYPGGASAARKLRDEFFERIDGYEELRNWPAKNGVSHLSVHLRFGTLSIRELFTAALARNSAGARKWADELVWREFYNAVLHFFPRTQTRAFREEFESVEWDDPVRDEVAAQRFAAWCEGRTGYPIVDAAMRQLNQTGYMHNRLRMIVASFLTKDLHIHWKAGERYFARKLLDYDLSQNLGGWQWSASTGADGQPYFRIFNPVSQGQTWDPDGQFVRQYCPELRKLPDKHIHCPWDTPPLEAAAANCVVGRDYPAPIVEHDRERQIALNRFKKVSKAERVVREV